MKNWLEDKTTLHDILKHGDLANTISGGTTQTMVSTKKKGNDLEISATAAGVHSSDFRVTLSDGKLTITRYLDQESFGFGHVRLSVPVFQKQFTLPLSAEREKIKAYYDEGLLRIVVPIKDEREFKEI